MKEALFSIIAPRVPGSRVLDVFAGSGALGFEALSRGAHHVTFVEASPPVARALRRTAQELDIIAQIDLLIGPAERVVSRLEGRYDLVFADPPYASAVPAALFAVLAERGLVDRASLVVYEHSSRAAFAPPSGYTIVREAAYGSVGLTFLQAEAA